MTSRRPSEHILVGLFLFLYLPLTFHYGWVLLGNLTVDFPSYYYAARLAFVEGKTPYGFAAFDPITAQLGRKVHPYLYPPPSLLAFWPLARLSVLHAQAAFLAVSHFCYLGSIRLLLTKCLPPFPNRRLHDLTLCASLVYLFCFDPAHATLALGQVNLVTLFCICVMLSALLRDSPAWCIALPLSIAILLKTYPVLLLPLLLFRRKSRAALYTCLMFGLYAAIAALVLPHEVWTSWFAEILPAGGYANNGISAAGPWNQNINGFVTRLFQANQFSEAPLAHPSLAKPVATILAVVIVGVTCACSFRLARRDVRHMVQSDECAAFLLMIFLIAPLSWDHHLVYILPAAVLAIRLIANGETGRTATALLLAALFLMAWKIPFDHPALMHGWWTLLISIKFYPVVALWLFFITRLLRKAVPLPHPQDETASAGPPATQSEFAVRRM